MKNASVSLPMSGTLAEALRYRWVAGGWWIVKNLTYVFKTRKSFKKNHQIVLTNITLSVTLKGK